MEKQDLTKTLYKVLYSLIIFLSAFLMFIFEPVTGKIITPQYGGGADIWTGCLLFFQFVLFIGYLVALLLNRADKKIAVKIYGAMFIAAVLLFNMPTEFGSWRFVGALEQFPLLSLFLSLFCHAMLPVFVLSTVSVLMQNWYTKQTGEQPYILYSISNAGSFLALFIYPFVFEPIMGLKSVINLWHGWFILLTLLIITACVLYFKSPTTEASKEEDVEKISLKKYLYWILLSAAGTILLASYTSFATVAIMPMPMLWTLFLGIYLLTFVLSFGSEKFYKKNLYFILLVLVCLLSPVLSSGGSFYLGPQLWLKILFVCAIFYLLLMFANGEIYKTRPNKAKLSEFYLAIAFGGVLGGLFVNVLAPVIFNTYLELPLINIVMYIFAAFVVLKDIVKKENLKNVSMYVKCGLIIVFSLILANNYYFFVKPSTYLGMVNKRNFYGVAKTYVDKSLKVKFVNNGDTIHGAQFYDPESKKFSSDPLTYYHDVSALAFVYEGMKDYQSIKNRPLNFGAIGLGAGTAAAYTQKGDKITFYEIDPKMKELAENEFAYLKNAKGEVKVVMGDARVELEKHEGEKYDILLVDAFSSDAVPLHLITKEAIDVYKKNVKDDGIILFNISSRFLSMDALLGKLADLEGLKSITFETNNVAEKDSKKASKLNVRKCYQNSVYYIMFMPENKLYKNFKDTNMLVKRPWGSFLAQSFEGRKDKYLKSFTDDYSSVVRILSFWTEPEEMPEKSAKK